MSSCLATFSSPSICLSLPILASPGGRASGPLPGARPLPPSGVCLQSQGRPGLWRPVGAALPPPAGAAAEPVSAGSLFGKHPRAGGTAPGQARAPSPEPRAPRPAPGAGTMTAQRIRRYTPGGPSPQTRARTHTVPHTPSPAGSARTGAEPTRDPRARKQPPAPALGPTPPATLRHANTPPAPAGARPAQPPPPPPRRSHLAALPAPLGAAPSAPRPCSAPGPLRRDGPGPRRLRAASSRGHPGPGEGASAKRHTPPLVPMPRPLKSPAPPETPPLAAKLSPSQQSSAPSWEATPLHSPAPRPWEAPPTLRLRNSLAHLHWFGDSPVSVRPIPQFRLPQTPPSFLGTSGFS